MKLRYLFAALCLCLLLVSPAAAAGGSGTAADPYIIQTAAELQSIQNNLAAYYQLANDIDMSSVTWTPIGSRSAPFIGSIDGGGHTIYNLNNCFILVVSGFTLKNINFESVNININDVNIGLIGYDVGSTLNPGVGVTLSNININNAKVIGMDGSGILFGHVSGGTFSEIYISNSFTDTQNSYGGASLIGVRSGYDKELIISNVIIENCISLGSTNYGSALIVGYSGNRGIITIEDTNIYNSIVHSSGDNAGLIVGYFEPTSSVTITDTNIYNSVCSANRPSGFMTITGTTSTIQNCNIQTSCIIGSEIAAGIAYYSGGTETIINSNIIKSNVYAVSNIYNIGVSGSYDSTSTATGTTNVPNRYLYASGLTATPNGATVSYTLEGQQGSTTVEATQGTAQSWAWTFGDGQTSTAAQDTTHTYAGI